MQTNSVDTISFLILILRCNEMKLSYLQDAAIVCTPLFTFCAYFVYLLVQPFEPALASAQQEQMAELGAPHLQATAAELKALRSQVLTGSSSTCLPQCS